MLRHCESKKAPLSGIIRLKEQRHVLLLAFYTNHPVSIYYNRRGSVAYFGHICLVCNCLVRNVTMHAPFALAPLNEDRVSEDRSSAPRVSWICSPQFSSLRRRCRPKKKKKTVFAHCDWNGSRTRPHYTVRSRFAYQTHQCVRVSKQYDRAATRSVC